MQKSCPFMLVVLCTALAASGCGANPATGPSPVVSTDAFIRAVEDQGVRITRMEEMPRQSHPFFSVPAQRLTVSGENVYVFQYASAPEADREAATISRDGSQVGNSHIDWIGPPRFYRKDRLIVLYVGATQDVVRALESVLGNPVAAR